MLKNKEQQLFKKEQQLHKLLKKEVEKILQELHSGKLHNFSVYIWEDGKSCTAKFDIKEAIVNFDLFEKLSKIFKSKKIDIANVEFMSGCPTCDYGRSETFEFCISEIKYKKILSNKEK